jgi:uncharacterized membrane protein
MAWPVVSVTWKVRSRSTPSQRPSRGRDARGGRGRILGVPLLYTQETWLEGSSVSPGVILTGLVVVLGLNVALSYFVGFRPGRTQRPTEDAVVGMGLSILLATVLLVLLDRIGPGTSPENALGMIALLTIPVSIGFSVGAALAPQGGGVKVRAALGIA